MNAHKRRLEARLIARVLKNASTVSATVLLDQLETFEHNPVVKKALFQEFSNRGRYRVVPESPRPPIIG